MSDLQTNQTIRNKVIDLVGDIMDMLDCPPSKAVEIVSGMLSQKRDGSQRVPMTECNWRDISCAPKDGSRFLGRVRDAHVNNPSYRVDIIEYDASNDPEHPWRLDAYETACTDHYSHWHPLPGMEGIEG